MTISQLLIFDSAFHDPIGLGVIFVDAPTKCDVTEGIRSLNDKNREGVKLIREDGTFMAIGQGYHCHAVAGSPPVMFRLVDSQNVETGNGDADCVCLDLVLEAAEHYTETGQLKASLTWQES